MIARTFAAVVLLLGTIGASGEPLPVVAADGHEVVGARVEAAAAGPGGTSAYWVAHNVAAVPQRLAADSDGSLRLAPRATSRLLILDATSLEPVERGTLVWAIEGLPEGLRQQEWSASGGALDIGCAGGESVELSSPWHQSSRVRLEVDNRRRTVFLERRGSLSISLEPPAAGRLWLAREDDIGLLALFSNVAQEHRIGDDGRLVLDDLEAGSRLVGVIVVPGRAPIVGRIASFPAELALRTRHGLGVGGMVTDDAGAPLVGARVEVTGRIDELDLFPYRQQATAANSGRFRVDGLLPGAVTLRACAEGRACVERSLELTDGGGTEDLLIEMAPGIEVRLVVEDQRGRPVEGARVVVDGRRLSSGAGGEVEVGGVEVGRQLTVEVRGAGVVDWMGSIIADRPRIRLQVTRGGVLEQAVLTNRDLRAEDVHVGWLSYTAEGRELACGEGTWHRDSGVARAEGLDTGRYRLTVRVPGSRTLVSAKVEVEAGDEVVLAPAVPEMGGMVRGRVVDGASWEPVAGATVRCEPGSPASFRKPDQLQHQPQVFSDADGLFVLDGLDPGPCRLQVAAAGYASWREDGLEPDEAGLDVGDVELGPGLTIDGVVQDRQGYPVAGARVEVFEDEPYAFFPEQTLGSGDDGSFRAELLPPGRWKVVASRGDRSGRQVVAGERGDVLYADIALGGVRVEGQVLLGGEPAPGGWLVLAGGGARGDGVVVLIDRGDTGRTFFGVPSPPVRTEVDAGGFFVADGVDPGHFTATYTAAGSGAGSVSRELVVPDIDRFACELRFAGGAVEGVVVDPDGLPVAGALVSARSEATQEDLMAVAGGDGAFVIQGVSAGRLALTATHSGFTDSDVVTAEIDDRGVTGPIELWLQPLEGASVAVRLTSGRGSVTGAPVVLVGSDGPQAFTDSAGVAVFEGVAAGDYLPCALAFSGPTGCGELLQVDDGDRREVALDLGAGGWIAVLGAGKSAGGLRVHTGGGVDLTGMLLMASPPQMEYDQVLLGPLRAGEYSISLHSGRAGTAWVAEGETAELDLR